jgi:hypothetical protein
MRAAGTCTSSRSKQQYSSSGGGNSGNGGGGNNSGKIERAGRQHKGGRGSTGNSPGEQTAQFGGQGEWMMGPGLEEPKGPHDDLQNLGVGEGKRRRRACESQGGAQQESQISGDGTRAAGL